MSRLVKDGFEVFLFFLLTLALYFLFIVTVPILRETHGLLAMSELSDITQSGWILGLLFGSAGVCVLLGIIVMNWAPFFTPGVMANLWAMTYFFVWIDCVFSLSIQSKSFKYLTSLGIGLGFIYLFFFIVNYLGVPRPESNPTPVWKLKVIHYWIWGWMGFYFGLSGFLVFYSFDYPGFRLPLAMGAMIVCFLNYLLCLFLKKSQGKDIERFSQGGRIIFTAWALVLTAIWISWRWLA